jgi:hypothetical protein
MVRSYGSFFFRQASEQYLTDSQFLAQDFLQVISFLQTMQILLERELLFPLNDKFVMTSLKMVEVIQNVLRMQNNFFLIFITNSFQVRRH